MDIEKLWYKITKAAIGAVFNIKQVLAEVILGLPPILLLNEINKVKHYLKLNIKKTKWDKLVDDIKDFRSESAILKSELSPVFKFLQWKVNLYPNLFSEVDKSIISSKDISKYTELSGKSCNYSKMIMKKYTESVWQTKINNQYMDEGYGNVPLVNCEKLPIPRHTSREIETILISHFYENNLMNGFLYSTRQRGINTPLCLCTAGIQTPYHSLVECGLVSEDVKQELKASIEKFFNKAGISNSNSVHDHITLLNTSRNRVILELMLKAIQCNKHRFRTKIILRKDTSAHTDTEH